MLKVCFIEIFHGNWSKISFLWLWWVYVILEYILSVEVKWNKAKVKLSKLFKHKMEIFFPMKHVFLVLKITISMKRFFWVPTTCFDWEIRKNNPNWKAIVLNYKHNNYCFLTNGTIYPNWYTSAYFSIIFNVAWLMESIQTDILVLQTKYSQNSLERHSL